MPNAGIQAWRSTNWKSADVGVEPGPQQQRLGEHQQRDDQRDFPDQRFVLLVVAEQQQRSAPTIGSAISDVRIGNVIRRSSPATEA